MNSSRSHKERTQAIDERRTYDSHPQTAVSEEGNRDASTLMPSTSNQGEETVDTGTMHEEEEADGDDDADEEDFDMDF